MLPGLLPSGDLLPGDPGYYGPQVFQVQITDLYGNVLTWTNEFGATQAWIEQYTALSVSLAVSDDRTASVTLSLYHPAVALLIKVNEAGDRIATLARMIRIKYRGTTIFWGLVVTPKISTEKAQIEINCQGPTYKLRHRQLNLGDDIVSPDDPSAPRVQNPSDWSTMKAIVEAAYDTPGQYALNIPDIGVLVENVSGVDAPEAFWTQIERGSNNWDELQQVTESAFGGEFDVIPHDPTPHELPFDTTLVPVVIP